nr:ABC transporter permease subunit [Nonomuraea sp. SYSU D8015]
MAFSAPGWVVYARIIRSEVRRVRERDYVSASYRLGLSHAAVLVRHVLPNALRQSLVYLATDMGMALQGIAVLSFFGLGVEAGTPELGAMVSEAQVFLRSHWWLAAFPRAGHRHPRIERRRPRRSVERDGGAGMTLLQVDELYVTVHRRGKALTVLDGVSFTVAAGQCLGIVGESRSGKSLLLRATMGLLHRRRRAPSAGSLACRRPQAGRRIAGGRRRPRSRPTLARLHSRAEQRHAAAGCDRAAPRRRPGRAVGR